MLNSKKKIKNFTEGPLLPLIIKFSIPLMITGILQLLFNTADTIVVGRWGGDTPEACEAALGAVGSCGSLINLLTLLFVNLSLGAGVLTAQDIGAKNHKGVEKTVHTSVAISLIASVMVMLIGFIFAEPLLRLMGTDEAVLKQAIPYMIAYFFGMPGKMLYNFLASILRAAGESMRPMIYLTLSGVVNVGLNLIMVLVFKMGALGVGIATAASFWVVAIALLIYMMRTDAPYQIKLKKIGFDGNKFKRILQIGIPAGLQGVIFSVSHVLIQSSINSLGTAVVAGNAAAANVEGYVYQPMVAFYQAAVTFVGQHKGAHKYRRMKKCILLCMACVAITGILLSAIVLALGPTLLKLYVPDNLEAVKAGLQKFYFSTSLYFICGLMEVGSGVMRGIGRSTTSMVTALLGSVAFRITWILFVFPKIPTLMILYISYPISWIVTAAAHFTLAAFALKKESREANALARKKFQEQEKLEKANI